MNRRLEVLLILLLKGPGFSLQTTTTTPGTITIITTVAFTTPDPTTVAIMSALTIDTAGFNPNSDFPDFSFLERPFGLGSSDRGELDPPSHREPAPRGKRDGP